MFNPVKAAEAYTRKLLPERVKEDFVTNKPEMVASYTTHVTALVALEDVVKGILAQEDVDTVDYPKYHTFARQIYKLKQRFTGGNGLVNEVAVLLATWRARGCDNAILGKIRDEAFGIPAPGG